MNACLTRILRSLFALAAISLVAPAAAQSATARIVGAAENLLSTLDQTQRRNVLFAFDDEEQRARWSNLPITIVRRAGLSMGELNDAQRSAALALAGVRVEPQGLRESAENHGRRRASQAGRRREADVREGSLLHLHSWARRPRKRRGCCSSAATTSRSTSRSRANAACSRRVSPAPNLPCTRSTADDPPSGPGERQGVRIVECARRCAAQAGDPDFPRRRSRARTGSGRQDDPAGRAQGFRDERAAEDHAPRPDSGVDRHRSRQRGRRPDGRDQGRASTRPGSPGADRRPSVLDATARPITGFRDRIW